MPFQALSLDLVISIYILFLKSWTFDIWYNNESSDDSALSSYLKKRTSDTLVSELLKIISLLHRIRPSASSVSREHDVKRLSFLGKAIFIATGIWHMIKMPEFVKNPENTEKE